MKKIISMGAAVLAASLLSVSGASSAPGDKLCVTKDYLITGLAVKASPSTDAETVMVIGAGRMVIEFGPKGGWLMVGVSRAGGRDGYIPATSVSSSDLDGMPCGS